MTSHDSLEQALHIYGDELYQTALLLTLNPEQAGQSMVRTVSALASLPPESLDSISLTAALLFALPEKPRPLSRDPLQVAPQFRSLVAAIARLPTKQRLALDLILRRDHDPARLSALFGDGPQQASELLRDALLAVAPVVDEALTPQFLLGEGAPEACQIARASMAINHHGPLDPLTRGHLALCGGCRSVDIGWEKVRAAVESALRSAFRDVHVPEDVTVRAESALRPTQRVPIVRQLARPRLLQVIVPLAVIVIVALLVLPRPNRANDTTSTTPSNLAPNELVQRALDTLYRPGEGQGIWHGQYEMRWNFSSSVYASVIGDIWSDAQYNRVRTQLVHTAGGAPYEFALANGQYLWYACAPIYGSTLDGPIFSEYPNQVRMNIQPVAQAGLIRARLESGAWGIATDYLHQASAATDIRTWGRQSVGTSNEAAVIGFVGYSPLGPPEGANAPTPTTILLTINTTTGQLLEVREVSGPVGGEQIGQTTWQLRTDERLDSETNTASLFNVERAFNGLGGFQEVSDQAGIADPLLPMISANAIRSPADLISPNNRAPILLPSSLPAGIERIVSLEPAESLDPATLLYAGPSRMMTIRTLFATTLPTPQGFDQSRAEYVQQPNGLISLIPGASRRYAMTILRKDNTPTITEVFASGLSRDELLTLAEHLEPMSLQEFKQQIPLFRTPRAHDPAAFKALVDALRVENIAPGQARHIQSTSFQRHGTFANLPDPYHQQFYGDATETTTNEYWVVRNSNTRVDSQASVWNPQQQLLTQWRSSPSEYWSYSRQNNRRYLNSNNTSATSDPLFEPAWSIINVLGCGGATLQKRSDQTSVISYGEENWYHSSCMWPEYASLAFAQLSAQGSDPERTLPDPSLNMRYSFEPDSGPYLADVVDQPLFFQLFIKPDGSAYRFEVRSGTNANGLLLEAHEVTSDTTSNASAMAQGALINAPPPALITQDFRTDSGDVPAEIISESGNLGLSRLISATTMPIWYLPTGPETELRRVYAIPQPAKAASSSGNVFQDAVTLGLAINLTYAPPADDSDHTSQELFIGDAKRFGDYLRTQRAWEASEAISVQVGGASVPAWKVTARTGRMWTLLELNGSLIALDTTTPQRAARLEQLAVLQPQNK